MSRNGRLRMGDRVQLTEGIGDVLAGTAGVVVYVTALRRHPIVRTRNGHEVSIRRSHVVRVD